MYTSMKSSVLFHVWESSSCTTAVTSEYKWAKWLNTIDSTDCLSVAFVDLETLVNGAKFSTNIDDSICAMSSTPGAPAAGALRAVTQGQQGNSSQTETVSFATRAANYFRFLLFFIVYFVFYPPDKSLSSG